MHFNRPIKFKVGHAIIDRMDKTTPALYVRDFPYVYVNKTIKIIEARRSTRATIDTWRIISIKLYNTLSREENHQNYVRARRRKKAKPECNYLAIE